MATRRDPMGIGLAVLNRIASSPIVDRLKLRSTTEKAVYQGAKSGFRVAGAAGRTFKPGQGIRQADPPRANRPTPASSTSIRPRTRR